MGEGAFQVYPNESLTDSIKAACGDCGNACCYTPGLGWIPEGDCPTHDNPQQVDRINQLIQSARATTDNG